MILTPQPGHMVRPVFVAIRGAAITMFSFLAYFYMTGVTWEQKLDLNRPYMAAVALAFLLHYFGAWMALIEHLRRVPKDNANA